MDYYTLSQVWLNTTTEIDEINEKNGFRKDICSARICWSHYGNRNSQF